MRTSETIAALIKALVEAQAEITNPIKGSDNPFYKSRYAALCDCIDSTKAILAKNGLVVIQGIEGTDKVQVPTRLYHVSGEWIETVTEMAPTKTDPQGIASASTYARRYGRMAMLDVAGADMDDDGNAASEIPAEVREKMGLPKDSKKSDPEDETGERILETVKIVKIDDTQKGINKTTNKPWTLYRIELDNLMIVSTFDSEPAMKAQAAMSAGRAVKVVFRYKEVKGRMGKELIDVFD
jgi:hypothetical protein